jgi:transposase
MRMPDVILRAISGEIHWFQAAEILQMTPRNLRRWRERYERWGCNGLVDQRRCPSKHRVPLTELERVLQLYRDGYAGFNGRHFHEIVRREHGITLSYSYVKQALQHAGPSPPRTARKLPLMTQRTDHVSNRERTNHLLSTAGICAIGICAMGFARWDLRDCWDLRDSNPRHRSARLSAAEYPHELLDELRGHAGGQIAHVVPRVVLDDVGADNGGADGGKHIEHVTNGEAAGLRM